MNMKRINTCGSFLLLVCCSFGQKALVKPPYRNAALPVETRVNDLLSRMTTEEKIMQLDMFWGKEITAMTGHEATGYSEDSVSKRMGKTGIGSVHDFYPASADIANKIQRYALEKTRLGIPVLFIEEGLHGYGGLGGTSFPVPLALSGTWDTALIHRIGHVIGAESRAHGIDMILGPVLCLPRDPRWGRVEETYGEDPYLGAANGVAIIKGMQGNDLRKPDAVIAEPKHFSVHGIPEAGSNTAPVNIGEREARSSFLYVFEKAVREGGALAMMAAYSEIDGIPCVDNKWLLTDVLRKEWGFKGFVLSDLGAIRMSLENHAVAGSISDALAQTFKAGMNMQFYDFGHQEFLTAMQQAVSRKMLSMDDLDRAARDVIRIKFLLGLFDNPYIDTSLLERFFHSKEHQALALKAAQESICLLKNDNGLLPFKQNIHSVAVIGELATSTYLGGYANNEGKAVSILDGLKQRAANRLQIQYEKGYDGDSLLPEAVQRAISLVNASDITVIVIGENTKEVGEGKDRAHLDLGEAQLQLAKAVYATGKPVVAVLSNGRPLCINWVAEHIPSMLESWFLGETAGLAIADVLLGNVNPSGKLPMTFPRSVGQIPLYYNHKPTSRHNYVDEASTPLFSFGHGLSYTSFEYSDMTITPAQIPAGGTATITIAIKNTGVTEGTEVAQLYVRDIVGSVTTPVMSLRGFQRVSLRPGEKQTVQFKVNREALSLWNREMKHIVEPGEFNIMIGSSSKDIRKEGILTVK
jgi:beta-glucosidase